jgi:biotin operon repressor
VRGFDRIRAAYEAPGLDEHERAVLVLLAFMANEADDQARPSIAYIVEKTGKGERTVQRAIQRLKAAGHIVRKQQRYGVIYTVRPLAEPLTPAPQTGVPETGVSETGVSEGVQTRTTDTQTEKRTEKPQKASPSSVGASVRASVEIPDWVPADEWNGWAEMRKRIRKPLDSDRAIKIAITTLRKLAEDGHPPGEVLDQSTLNKWPGLYPIKDRRNDRSSSPASTPSRRARGSVIDACLAADNLVSFER